MQTEQVIREGDQFIDDDGDIFDVVAITPQKITLEDPFGVITVFPDQFDSDNFSERFTKV